MDGRDRVQEVANYLSRLTGEEVSVERSLQLRSVHRAAFIAWARREGIALRLEALGSGARFDLQALLSSAGAASLPSALAATAAASTAVVPVAISGGVSVGMAPMAIGIDIEEVDNLPETDDYREHPFFKDNFTDAEIAHCIRQVDVRASFCGTWAAKEAVLKAGLATAPKSLRHVEITRDAAGRPFFGSCLLSISHTPRTAVAVCVAMPAAPLNIAPVIALDSVPVPAALPRAEQTISSGADSLVPRRSKGFRLPWTRAEA